MLFGSMKSWIGITIFYEQLKGISGQIRLYFFIYFISYFLTR